MLDNEENFEDALLREIAEETGINIEKLSDKSFIYKTLNNTDAAVKITPFMLYESIFPDFLEKGLATAQCLVLFYSVKFNADKDEIKIKYNRSEVDSFCWVNISDLYSILYEDKPMSIERYEYNSSEALDSEFKKIIMTEKQFFDRVNNPEAIPYGHSLAIKKLVVEENFFQG